MAYEGIASRTFLIVGDGSVARRTIAALTARSYSTTHLPAPGDDELRAALELRPAGVAVLIHDDVTSLRYALAAAHMSAGVPLVAMIFDRTISEQLSELLPHCHITSPADLVVPSLAGPCLRDGLIAAHLEADGSVDEVVESTDGRLLQRTGVRHRHARWRSVVSGLTGLVKTPDTGTRMLLLGLWGLSSILFVDWCALTFIYHHDPVLALRESVGVIATVGLGDLPPPGYGYAIFSSISMLLTLVLTALFTAGVVDRILGPRLSGIVGSRVLPTSGHVIVVGLGQVGLRLCRELVRLGLPVVGVERDREAMSLRLLRDLGVPAVLGHGGDRKLLLRLGVLRAQAIASVGSDDLDNIAVALAVRGISPSLRMMIRAGEHESIEDTESLLHMGTLRDVAAMTTAYVVAVLLGGEPVGVVNTGTDTYIRTPTGGFEHFDEFLRPGWDAFHG